jgi:pyruvate dehydrogenase kinase 2/3/4
VHDALEVGISKIIVLLQNMPLGLSSIQPIRSVIAAYIESLRELQRASPHELPKVGVRIFTRHADMVTNIALGLSQFRSEVSSNFVSFGTTTQAHCEDLGDHVPAIRRIEDAMDDFFTFRATLRLLIKHCLELTGSTTPVEWDTLRFRKLQHELHQHHRHIPGQRQDGAVCLDVKPVMILGDAFEQVRALCVTDFGRAPCLLINGVDSDIYFDPKHADINKACSIPYVEVHLYFIFFEVLKNAVWATMKKTGCDGDPSPINVSIMFGCSMSTENERTLKIADSGDGMQRGEARKVWSYFYTTSDTASDPQDSQATHNAEVDRRWTGGGIGLPVSRVLARYFGGEIDLHSIPRKGTDVYIYL